MALILILLTSSLLIWLLFRMFQIQRHLLMKIAELSRVSRDLSSANARLQALHECGSIALWEIDDHIRFTWLSTHILDGHAFDITVGSNPVDSVHPEDMARVRGQLRQCVQDHLPF